MYHRLKNMLISMSMMSEKKLSLWLCLISWNKIHENVSPDLRTKLVLPLFNPLRSKYYKKLN